MTKTGTPTLEHRYPDKTEREIRQICIEESRCVGYWLDDSNQYRVYCDLSSASFCDQDGVSVDNLEDILGSNSSSDQVSTSRSCMVLNNIQEHDTASLQIDSGTFSDSEGRLNEDSTTKNISMPRGIISWSHTIDYNTSRVMVGAIRDGIAAPDDAEGIGFVMYVVFEREAREFQSISCFNYVTRISLTSLTHATKKQLEKQRSNTNAMMAKTKLALRARTQVLK